ncbi:ABC transporter ATP-binding protein [Variovorax guangxiensis]|uniref:ABC transporter ATP-binding protein n=1 Tax=Variovorax guangxiensis TaxID=1775474 RepID=A0A502DEY7_9BURK|nr:ABC transporter ATP-binding protein [Variovorax guangxiensis]TPG17497.1 ABC transporter ATP-binding protein [Variovorax ginsengisoli]TPG23584.1 ABC transporter ATP-binding protein [Variovorax guangxiensis]
MNASLLTVRGLTRRFGGLTAVDNVDLDVRKGEIHGLIGPNGSGKTTCINLLSGVLKSDAGSVTLEGTEIARRPTHVVAAAGLARTFQNIRVFGRMTVLQNVLVGFNQSLGYNLLSVFSLRNGAAERRLHEQGMALLEFVGLADKHDTLATNLSYGEQRLIEIARARALSPRLLLLDEPLVGMNPTEVDRVVDLFQRMRGQGLTMLLVEHKMRVVMSVCDQITVLNFGRKIAGGQPDEIRADPEVIRAYLGENHGIRKKRTAGS